MSDRETDDVTGIETTGHEWDGIKELDTPLPRWWLWTFYGCIAVAVVYWILMPAWPGLHGYTKGLLHQSDRVHVVQQLADLNKLRGTEGEALKNASLEQIEKDPKLQAYALAVGQSVFGDNCATCHGVGGTGGKGYPNLRDDVWLWGGSLEDIQHTIQVGVRSDNPNARTSQMPAFGRDGMLKPTETPGAGIEGWIGGRRARLGRAHFVGVAGASSSETELWFAFDGETKIRFRFSDQIRPRLRRAEPVQMTIPFAPPAMIVIVEDDAAVLGALGFALEMEGFHVRPFRTGAELNAATDLGPTACMVIDAPAVVITTNPPPAVRAQALRLNAPLIEKPLLDDQLFSVIRKLAALRA